MRTVEIVCHSPEELGRVLYHIWEKTRAGSPSAHYANGFTVTAELAPAEALFRTYTATVGRWTVRAPRRIFEQVALETVIESIKNPEVDD